jgi:thioredoxin reductase
MLLSLLSGGLGSFEPKTIDRGYRILRRQRNQYFIKNPENSEIKVVIAGGGDSALDWVYSCLM